MPSPQDSALVAMSALVSAQRSIMHARTTLESVACTIPTYARAFDPVYDAIEVLGPRLKAAAYYAASLIDSLNALLPPAALAEDSVDRLLADAEGHLEDLALLAEDLIHEGDRFAVRSEAALASASRSAYSSRGSVRHIDEIEAALADLLAAADEATRATNVAVFAGDRVLVTLDSCYP